MKRNVGNVDRIVRLVVGVAAVVGGIAAGGVLGVALFVVAAIMVVTAAVGTCPLYSVFGIDTCRLKSPAPR